jgi:hypothetical protein
MDLTTASRDELIALVGEQQAALAAQQATIATLRAAVAQLEQRVRELEAGSGRPQGMPGHKPEQRDAAAPKPPRKKRARNFARRRMAPTARVRHAAEACPRCGTRLAGGAVQRTREVIELALVPVTVTEHVYLARCCPHCKKRVVPPADLAGVVVGQQRLGVGLVSLIATLREVGRLPLHTIRWYLATFHQLQLSGGALVGALKQVARQGQGALADIRHHIRRSPAVNADETGWREAGANRYVWTFATPTERYFVAGGRNKEVVDEVLGERFDGVLISDFYAAYDHYPGVKQRCWAHLLRDIHDLRRQHPADATLARWADAVHTLYTRATAAPRASPAARRQAQRDYERELLALCQPALQDQGAPQRTLCRRIAKHLPELFVFVADPAVPADNNAAERALRPLVTSRKISGGTRSPDGTATKLALASLFGTWRAEGRNPFTACRELLAAP